jgi:uncharacterized FlgJ-related protein
MDRGCWASQIVDFVNLQIEWEGDVVANELKARVLVEMLDVPFGTCKKIVDANYLMPLVKQSRTQVRADKTGSACD